MLDGHAPETIELCLHPDRIGHRLGEDEVAVDTLGGEGAGERHPEGHHRAGPELVDGGHRDPAPEIPPEEALQPLLGDRIAGLDERGDGRLCRVPLELSPIEADEEVEELRHQVIAVATRAGSLRAIVLGHTPVLPRVESQGEETVEERVVAICLHDPTLGVA